MHQAGVQPVLEQQLSAAHAEWQRAVQRLREAERLLAHRIHDEAAREAAEEAERHVRSAGKHLARVAERLHRARRRATRTDRE